MKTLTKDFSKLCFLFKNSNYFKSYHGIEKLNFKNEYTFSQKPLVAMVLIHSNKSKLIILLVRTHNNITHVVTTVTTILLKFP